MSEKILEISHISKSFHVKMQIVNAVNDVNFSIKEGNCLGLIGESGSGKSTIAQIIAGFLKADSGEIRFLDKNIDVFKKDFKSRYGMQIIFQDPLSSLNPKMKIKKILSESALYLSHMNENQRILRAKEVLNLVHIPEKYLERYSYELSGGECQRIAIARSLMLNPKLLICDEITSALDVSVQVQIIKILNELKKDKKISILFITHDLSLVSSICDDIAVLHNGSIIEKNNTYNILHNPEQDYTKILLNSVLTINGLT